jgi:predicted nucleic acid-binding protein
MSGEAVRFALDTNILIYSLDRLAGPRHQIAAELVIEAAERDCCLALQSVSEFYAAVTRKRIISPAEAAAQASDWLDLFPCVAPTASAAQVALAAAAAARASDWTLCSWRLSVSSTL